MEQLIAKINYILENLLKGKQASDTIIPSASINNGDVPPALDFDNDSDTDVPPAPNSNTTKSKKSAVNNNSNRTATNSRATGLLDEIKQGVELKTHVKEVKEDIKDVCNTEKEPNGWMLQGLYKKTKKNI